MLSPVVATALDPAAAVLIFGTLFGLVTLGIVGLKAGIGRALGVRFGWWLVPLTVLDSLWLWVCFGRTHAWLGVDLLSVAHDAATLAAFAALSLPIHALLLRRRLAAPTVPRLVVAAMLISLTMPAITMGGLTTFHVSERMSYDRAPAWPLA